MRLVPSRQRELWYTPEFICLEDIVFLKFLVQSQFTGIELNFISYRFFYVYNALVFMFTYAPYSRLSILLMQGLYKGFFAQWIRIGPHTLTAFVVLEQLRRLFGLEAVGATRK